MTPLREASAFRLLGAADVAAIDAAAARNGAPGTLLMERAGAAVARVALRRFPGARRIEVWAGPGKNGGDGWVAARHLAIAGRRVRVRALTPPEALSGDARQAFEAWAAIGGIWRLLDPESIGQAEVDRGMRDQADLMIDALFGVGLTRPIEGVAAAAINRFATLRPAPPVLAIDMPSGVHADTGRVLGAAVRATTTVTFVRPKRGLRLADGAERAGEIVVADILDGLPQRAAAMVAAASDVGEIRPEMFAGAALAKTAYPAHKFSHGHAIAVTGGFGATGAARLAAQAALRSGAGLVTVAAPGNALAECAAQLTAVMLRRADAPDAIAATLSDPRVSAIVLGPGHAQHPGGFPRTAATVSAVLEAAAQRRANNPDEIEPLVVLDADALSCWGAGCSGVDSGGAERAAFFKAVRRAGRVVLTPHLGEFARLFPDLAAKLSAASRDAADFGKVEATREAAARCGATVLLKGADTVVASPDGRVGVHAAFGARAAAWLATAGSGDVLAGVATGLGARGWPPFEAAAAAAWLHVEAARSFGPGLIAEDLPDAMPRAVSAAIAKDGG